MRYKDTINRFLKILMLVHCVCLVIKIALTRIVLTVLVTLSVVGTI